VKYAYRFASSLLASLICGVGLAQAQTQPSVPSPASPSQNLPDLIKQAGALNLGGTSFYDGFGRLEEGFTFLQYFHYADLSNSTLANGAQNPALNQPIIQSEATLEQLAFTTPWRPFGGAVAFSAAVPVVNFQTHFSTPGTVLRDNGLGIGDVTFGPIYQSPVYMSGGRPVFSWRVQLQIIAPAGEFNVQKDINQGSGFWVVNPYYTFTWLPIPKWEVSARLHYVYNLRTDNFADPPPVPGLVYRNAQAGQAGFVNFAASYAFSDRVAVGVNGFYLQQFTDDRLNGANIAGSRERFLYIGPGAHLTLNESNTFNMNFNLPVFADDVTSGPQINLQLIHKFGAI
jgi:hypothetical protein